MRAAWIAGLVLLAGVPAAPALGQGRSVDVRISVHLVSDYRFGYHFTERDSPDCPVTIDADSRVVADMTTDRQARYRITRVRGPRGGGYSLVKRLGGGQRETLGVDMTVTMDRQGSGGSQDPCYGPHTYPTVNCGRRSWPAYGEIGIRPGAFGVGIRESSEPSIEEMMELEQWRGGGCGFDSTHGQVYITQTRNEQGRITPAYEAPLSVRRLFAKRPRVMRLRATLPFELGDPQQQGGGYTEVRTVEVTIRKLR